jgi:hypothetical protein
MRSQRFLVLPGMFLYDSYEPDLSHTSILYYRNGVTNKEDKTNAPLIRYSYKTALNTLDKESLYIQKDGSDPSEQKPQQN